MSKIKIIVSLIFAVCILCFSVLWMGVFPYWSIATQPVSQQYDPSQQTEATDSSEMDDVGQANTIYNNNEVLSSEEPVSVTPPTLPGFLQLSQGESPEDSNLSQLDESEPQTKQDQSVSEQNSSPENSNYDELQPSNGEQQTPAGLSGTLGEIPDHSQAKPSTTISEKEEELAPSPLPAPPGTPVHPYYDEAGNPPTAPGLAMRQRKFKPEKGKIAYLTFDDGPYPSTTPKILAILAQENVQATFFDIGKQAESYPDLLKAEYEQGHSIGNHTYSHNMAEVYKGPQEFLTDVKKCEEIIYQTIGMRPQIVRAPGGTVGHFNIDYFNTVDAAGYLMEDWNVDPGDTEAHLVPAEQLIQRVEQQIKGKTRVVILLHDLAGKDTTIKALPQIIEKLKEEGFSFGVLGPHVLPIVFPVGLHN